MRKLPFWCLLVSLLMLSGCSSLRFIPEDKTLLASVKMHSASSSVKASDYRRFVRQEANSRWISCIKVPLGLYCMSGTDSTRRFNRFMHRIGEAPVRYDSLLTDYSCTSIEQTLQGRGYLGAKVSADAQTKKRRTRVRYMLQPGERSYVSHLHYSFDNPDMERLVMASPMQEGTLLYRGMPFDVSVLDEERKRIIRNLHNIGYYGLNQDFIYFQADTLAGDYGVDLTLHLECPATMRPEQVYVPYRINKVSIYEESLGSSDKDSSLRKGYTFYVPRGERNRISRTVKANHTHLVPGEVYSEYNLHNTYQSLNSLGLVHYTTVRTVLPEDTTTVGGYRNLDADILLNYNKEHGISFELEGTNTAGDLGAAASATYTNRNFFRGAEILSLKVRGAFEAIKGLEGYANENYIEYGADLSLRVPRLMLPLHSEILRRVRSATEFSLQFNSQDRPEFHRRVWTGALTYQWVPMEDTRLRHRVEAFSLNYLYMPWISPTFRRDYLDNTSSRNSILRYSYEDLFIMKMGYGFTFNSLRQTGVQSLYNTDGYQIRLNTELAGSLLYGISAICHMRQNSSGEYVIANIPFSQYVKADFDFSKSIRLSEQSSLALHAAAGAAIPFGNSTMIPYEKRYFSGGANSVRGWSVRELGPGAYTGRDGKVDFINQTGNLRLDLSAEYRTFLFWKIHGALFVDAGNVWNTRHYEGLEAGEFHWSSFYKQIAAAYGAGIRLNFGFFILRFDGGMKAVNPAYTDARHHFPIIHPHFKRDFTFHFAVGLPF